MCRMIVCLWLRMSVTIFSVLAIAHHLLNLTKTAPTLDSAARCPHADKRALTPPEQDLLAKQIAQLHFGIAIQKQDGH